MRQATPSPTLPLWAGCPTAVRGRRSRLWVGRLPSYDWISSGGGFGEDVIYGGDGSDNILTFYDNQPDKLYCGKGKDYYAADKHDYADSSCEVEMGSNA
jgi:hypothetical protein